MKLDKKIMSYILAVPLAGALSFGVWALDSRYLTIASFEQLQQQEQEHQLGNRIDELTLKESLGYASEYEKALLKQLKEKIKRYGNDNDN